MALVVEQLLLRSTFEIHAPMYAGQQPHGHVQQAVGAGQSRADAEPTVACHSSVSISLSLENMENPYDIYVYLKQHNIQKLAHLFPNAPLVGICWYDHIPSPMPFIHSSLTKLWQKLTVSILNSKSIEEENH